MHVYYQTKTLVMHNKKMSYHYILILYKTILIIFKYYKLHYKFLIYPRSVQKIVIKRQALKGKRKYFYEQHIFWIDKSNEKKL